MPRNTERLRRARQQGEQGKDKPNPCERDKGKSFWRCEKPMETRWLLQSAILRRMLDTPQLYLKWAFADSDIRHMR